MNYKDKYNEWLAFADENTKAELESITDEKEIEDRFYKDLTHWLNVYCAIAFWIVSVVTVLSGLIYAKDGWYLIKTK